MARSRWNLVISGHVQGVGFRFRTEVIARRYHLDGWVANLDNGCVRVVVEGPVQEIEHFVKELNESMGGFIRRSEIEKSSATGEFSRFEIRR